jgi:hypothetical protein
MQKRNFYLISILLGLLLLGVAIAWPRTAARAQCGSQASSCKTCHETQGKKSVNSDQTGWHTGHAFGDFCYSCHGGNNQSMVEAEAHTGMVPPMSDIKTACAGCHPDDLQDRADKYAVILGVTAGGGTQGGASSAPVATQPATTPQATPASPAAGTSSSAAPAAPAPELVQTSGEEINYVARYTGKTPINWGNVILVVLIVVVAIAGGAFVYWNERRRRGLALFGSAKPSGAASKPGAVIPVVEGYSTEVTALLPQIAQLNPVGLHSLKRLLQDPEQANEILHSLSHLDPELVQRIRMLDRDSRSLLLGLAGD